MVSTPVGACLNFSGSGNHNEDRYEKESSTEDGEAENDRRVHRGAR